MIDLLFLFLLAAGIYRYKDGCKRLNRTKEAAQDGRWRAIPDAEVVAWWHRLTELDRQFGAFFKYYGLFLIVISLLNLLLNLKTKTEIPLNGFTICFGFGITVALIVGWAIMGDNTTRIRSKQKQDERWPFAFPAQKDYVLEWYDIQEFQPMVQWTQERIYQYKKYHNEQRRHAQYVWELKSFKSGIYDLLNGVKRLKFGAIIYYGSWLLLILLTTAYHFCGVYWRLV